MTDRPQDTLNVNEIFFSIQGESTLIGKPCVFVRLTSCDLRCVWCDTAYAFSEGTEITLDSIFQKVKEYGCNFVEITGGEPLLQENVHALMKLLCDEGYTVMLETGGHRDISSVDARVKRIMDIKCPGSKMEKRNRWENIEFLTAHDEIKFVLSDQTDYEWAKQIMQKHGVAKRCPILMSPVFSKLENRTLAEWILRDHLNVQFQLQMHKYIWDPSVRGV
jgi:7-carboxy-7-deazaguanine synthase